MKDCLFCKIIEKQIPGHFVMEEDEFVAILDLYGSAPGHTMVIPKKHGYSILDYSEKELGVLMMGTQTLAKKMKNALNTNSITIGINHFEENGVPHLHIHLIPRHKNDGGKVIQSVVNVETKDNLAKIAEKIRNS